MAVKFPPVHFSNRMLIFGLNVGLILWLFMLREGVGLSVVCNCAWWCFRTVLKFCWGS